MHQNLKKHNLRQPKLNCSNPNLCRKIHKVFGAFLPPSHKGYDPKLVSKELLHFGVTVWLFQQIRDFVTDLSYVLLLEKLAIKYAKVSKAESFYDVINGSSTVTSKSSSKNLSNEINTLCF